MTPDARATQHRPHDEAGLRTAARQLAAMGLKPRDIANALCITESAVLPLLQGGAAITTKETSCQPTHE